MNVLYGFHCEKCFYSMDHLGYELNPLLKLMNYLKEQIRYFISIRHIDAIIIYDKINFRFININVEFILNIMVFYIHLKLSF